MNRIVATAFLCLVLTAVSGTSRAQNNNDEEGFNIEAQPLASALREFSKQTGLQIGYAAELTEGKQAAGVNGISDPEIALEALLASSGLEHRFINESTVIVRAVAVAAEQGGDGDAKKPQRTVMQMAQTSASNEAAGGGSARTEDDSTSTEENPWDFEEIVVTGSKLVDDPGKLTRQITIFNRAEIERSGATRLDEFLSRLPQNVNAPNNVGSGFGFSEDPVFGLGDNVFAGSSVNLRGLGAQYTLILIDGRRPARGGQFGEITDISNIPIDRIERIEILFDGAAAIYGADAVGGVVNIITNREYDGTSVSATYSTTDDGGGASYNLQLGRTFNWESGSLTASVTYQTQEQIDGAQRPNLVFGTSSDTGFGDDLFLPPSVNGNVRGQARGALVDGEIVISFAPLMWVNGDQRLSGGVEVPILERVFTGSGFEFVETTIIVDRQNPVLDFDQFWIDEAADRPQNPEALGFTPIYQTGLPQYSGQPLGIAELSASGELGENAFVPFEGLAISPEDETYSVALNFNQAVSDSLSLNLSLAYTDTYKASNNLGNDSLIAIPEDSPSNPFRQAFLYSFQNEFPQQFQEVSVTSYNASGGIDWDFAKDWSLAFGFGVSEQKSDSDTTNFLRLGGTGPDNLLARARGYHDFGSEREFIGSNFNDPLLGYGSQEEMLDALIIPFLHTHNYSELYDADIRLTGKLFGLPGGDVRSSLSLRYREDKTEIFDSNPLVSDTTVSPLSPPGSSSPTSDYEETFGEHVASLAAEFSVPVFGEDFKLPLVERFLLSFSGSLEDYSNTDDNGFNWAAGFNWGLGQDFVIRLNRTYSLRVPDSVRTAREPEWRRSDSFDVYADIDDSRPVKVFEPLWRILGGADHLKPERNYGTALSFIYRPSFVKGLDIQLSISESETVDQLGNPYMGRWTLDTLLPEAVLGNPLFAYGDPENNPMHAAVAGEIRLANGDTEQVEIQPGELIYDAREFNIGDTFNRGADLTVRYNLNTGFGDWMLTWRHQYLDANRVTRSNLCEQVETGCVNATDGFGEDVGYGESIDIVGSISRDNFRNDFALPRNRGSIELYWAYRGLGMTLATTYQETTSVVKTRELTEQVIVDYIEFNGIRIPIFEERISTNIIQEDTRPAQNLDFVLSYDFGEGGLFEVPRWLENARLGLTVNGLYRRERKEKVTYLQQEFDVPELVDINRLSINPRGRAYALRFSTTF